MVCDFIYIVKYNLFFLINNNDFMYHTFLKLTKILVLEVTMLNPLSVSLES